MAYSNTDQRTITTSRRGSASTLIIPPQPGLFSQDEEDECEEITLLPESDMVLSWEKTAKKLLKFSAPYVTYSLVLASSHIADDQVLRLTKNSAGLGSLFLIGTFIRFTMSFSKGLLDAASLIVSRLESQEKYDEIGQMVRVSMIVAAGLSVPVIGIFLSAGPLLELCGTDKDLAAGVSEFFNIFSFAVPAILGLNCSQQIALGLRSSIIAGVIGIAWVLLAKPVSYPLMLETDYSALRALALGDVVSSWVSLAIAGFIIRLKPSYAKYNIFACKLDNKREKILSFLKVGFPLGLQHVSEYVNPLVTGIYIGRTKEGALAAQVFSQMNNLIIYPVRAFGIATGVLVAEQEGKINASQEEANHVDKQHIDAGEEQEIHLKSARAANEQAWRFGMNGILICTAGACIIAIFDLAMPDQIRHAFISFPDDDESKGSINESVTIALATEMLYSNGVGVIFDSARIAAMGALSGYEYIWVPTLVSMGLISGVTLPISIGLVFLANQPLNTFFIVRDVAYTLSAGITSGLWYKKNKDRESEIELKEESEEQQIMLSESSQSSNASSSSIASMNMHAEQGETQELSEQMDGAEEVEQQSRCCYVM